MAGHRYPAERVAGLTRTWLDLGRDLRALNLFHRGRFVVVLVWETRKSAREREAADAS